MVDPLILGFPVSVLAQRSDGLREGGLTNIGAQRLTRASSPTSVSIHSCSSKSSCHRFTSCSVFRFEVGDPFPWIEVWTQRYLCPPWGWSHHPVHVSQFRAVDSSQAHHVDSIFVTSRLTAEQYEAIFLLSREVQTLRGKLALRFY